MKDATTILLAVLLGFLIGVYKNVRRDQTENIEGYETISCQKIDQKGDTIITINRLIPKRDD